MSNMKLSFNRFLSYLKYILRVFHAYTLVRRLVGRGDIPVDPVGVEFDVW